VPARNSDGTRPANIQRIDVYALTSPEPVPPDELVVRGTTIARLDVKGPSDPNEVIDADDPDEDMAPLVGPGLDQGLTTSVSEELTAADQGGDRVLRYYVAVPILKNGRRGLLSTVAAAPLGTAPPPPGAPSLTYDETNVTVTWSPVNTQGVGYHVYEIGPITPPTLTAAAPESPKPPPAGPQETRLTAAPADMPRFVDPRVEWEAERCYRVRAIEVVEGVGVESEASPTACVTLKDTFPPLAPSGLEAGSSDGAIRLVWDPNKEPDLAGYLVSRAPPSDPKMVPLTRSPIQETAFTDTVPSGSRYVYVVQAIDKSGNISPPSERKEETAR
jgi:hypothetical protein